MDLNELKTLTAAALLGGSVRAVIDGSTRTIIGPKPDVIAAAVLVAGDIWLEVLRQEKEEV
jgi:hypothetical protein